jgi:phosphotransferase system  glucose/maltose/N-acetylglucosamine-specific IIC component|uniref:Uncharacterized protein n=1 Tax=viral metagenome TaxID=1070528 RepID=A0A6C0DAK3_9ZZZZ
MDSKLVIAIVAAMINIILSLLLPALLKNSHLPFATEVKKNYECNNQVIIVSSVLVVVFVYTALLVSPWVETNVFSTLAKLNTHK